MEMSKMDTEQGWYQSQNKAPEELLQEKDTELEDCCGGCFRGVLAHGLADDDVEHLFDQ